MAIETHDSGAVTLTGDHIQWYGHLQLRHALELEIKGYKMMRSPAGPKTRRVIERYCPGVKPARGLKKLLRQYDEYLLATEQIDAETYAKWRRRANDDD